MGMQTFAQNCICICSIHTPSNANTLHAPQAHRRKMWWKQWCHARERRGGAVSWAVSASRGERHRGRVTAARSRGNRQIENGSRTQWTRQRTAFNALDLLMNTHTQKKTRWVRVVAVARTVVCVCFCLPFCFLVEKREPLCWATEDAGSDVSETKATCETVY